MGTPQHYPGQQHLYRTDALPAKIGAAIRQPYCLTCTSISPEAVTIRPAVKLVTVFDTWDADEEGVTLPELVTEPTKHRQRRKGTL